MMSESMSKICSFCCKVETCEVRKGMDHRKENPGFVDEKMNKHIKGMIQKIMATPGDNLGDVEIKRLRELDTLKRLFTLAEWDLIADIYGRWKIKR